MISYKESSRPSNTPILLPRARNFSEPPKFHENGLRPKPGNLPPMDLYNYSLNSSQFSEEKPLVNLRQVLQIEEKLSNILENLRQGIADKSNCDEYWSLTEDSTVPVLEKLFREKRTQISLRHTCIIELASVAFGCICFNENISGILLSHFRNLFYYIHQNFLSMMRLMLHRCSHESLTNT